MQKKNVQWLPMIASVGIGAAAYSMMTGQSGQLQNMVPGVAKMLNGSQQNGFQSNQQ